MQSWLEVKLVGVFDLIKFHMKQTMNYLFFYNDLLKKSAIGVSHFYEHFFFIVILNFQSFVLQIARYGQSK